MIFDPMPGDRGQRVALLVEHENHLLCDVLLLADPNIIRLGFHSLQELFEGDETPWSTDDMRVQCQGHHLWFTLFAFG